MHSYPLVSVMIPTYNQDRYIETCISSVLDQDYPNIEIIIGDDASTDRTREILATVQDPRVKKVVRNQNLGRVANYKDLLERHATGDWILNLDGDDLLASETSIRTLVERCTDRDSVVMVVGGVITLRSEQIPEVAFLDGIANTSTTEILRQDGQEISGIDLVENYWRDDHGMKHAGCLYRRDIAIKTGFYQLDIISSDVDSLLRLAVKGNVLITTTPTAIWRIHEDNTSGKNDLSERLANLALVETVGTELLKAIPEYRARRWKTRMKRRMVYGTAVRLARAQGRARALRLIGQAYPEIAPRIAFLLRPKTIFRLLFPN